jgi:DNA invertase Pin-like site-specific DNA recombinase
MAIHAGVYGRQSDKRENGSEVSTADQRELGIAEARRRQATQIRVYEDLGISAFKDGVERPDFNRLVADCRAGQLNMIIVYYISRLTRRDPSESLPLLMELLNIGVTIVSINEGVFRKDNLGDLITLIVRLDGSYRESKNKSEAVSSAKKKARKHGGYVGGTAPFGFYLEPDSAYETDENGQTRKIAIQVPRVMDAEAELIRSAWDRIREHMHAPVKAKNGASPGSLSGICNHMNEHPDEYPTRGARTGKKRANSRWLVGTLKRILMDPRISGMDAEPVYGTNQKTGEPTTKVAGYTIVRDPETMEPVPFGDGTEIIPRADWYELQAWLDGRGRGRGLNRGGSLLSGLRTLEGNAITTCECARPMGGLNNGATEDSAQKPNYRCTRGSKIGGPGEHSGYNTIAQPYLDEYVARRVFALIQAGEEDPEVSGVLAEAARRFGRLRQSPETAQERSSLLAERADAVRGLEELYDERDAGGFRSEIGRKRFRQSERKLEDRLSAADARLAEIGESETPDLPYGEWLPADDTDPIGPGSWWYSATRDERREFITLFVERITVRKAVKRGGHRWVEYDTGARVDIEWASAPEWHDYAHAA